MKKFLFLLVGLLIGLQVCAASFSFKFDGEGFISDGADVISYSDRQKIDKYLEHVKNQTSYSILVVTLDNLEGVSASQMAKIIAEHGAADDKDNILVFLVSPTEGKIGVEVGENLKSEISYISLKNIIQEEVSPSFKNGDYSDAITKGIYNISRIIEPSLVFLDMETESQASVAVAPVVPQKQQLQIEKKYALAGVVAFFGLIWFVWRLFSGKTKRVRRRAGFGNHFSL